MDENINLNEAVSLKVCACLFWSVFNQKKGMNGWSIVSTVTLLSVILTFVPLYACSIITLIHCQSSYLDWEQEVFLYAVSEAEQKSSSHSTAKNREMH